MKYEILNEEYAQVLNESVPSKNETHTHLAHVGITTKGGTFKSETPEHESKVKDLHKRLSDHGYEGRRGDAPYSHIKTYSKAGHHSVEINDRPGMTSGKPQKAPLSTVKTYKP